MTTTVLLAGATGMLGNQISRHLLDQPDVVRRLLLRAAPPDGTAKAQAVDALVARGAEVVTGDVTDPVSLEEASRGVLRDYLRAAYGAPPTGLNRLPHTSTPRKGDHDRQPLRPARLRLRLPAR